MMKHILILMFLTCSLNGQGIPRFLWNPVVKPIEWLNKDVNSSDSRQRLFDDPLNTITSYKLSRTESREKQTTLTINDKQVIATDRWLVHYYESNGRVGLDASRLIPIETATMTRSYRHPDGQMVNETLTNTHSSESSLTPYDSNDKLDNAQFYGNYFVMPNVWESNTDANLNVVDDSFISPLQNIVSTRNITSVMALGDLDYKMRLLSRFPTRYDIIFTTVNGQSIVQ
jgi:hypothetical protein